MLYDLFTSDRRYFGSKGTLNEARILAMDWYDGKPIYVYRVKQRDVLMSPESIRKLSTPIGYVTKNSDGFYYRNLEKRIVQYLKKDGSAYRYR